jgi:hypothetical protein
MMRFQCPNCSMGDLELGQAMDEGDIHCLVCLEELGRLIRIERWEEGGQARLRRGLASTGLASSFCASDFPPLIGSLSPA